jgi:hypothetical protein
MGDLASLFTLRTSEKAREWESETENRGNGETEHREPVSISNCGFRIADCRKTREQDH